MLAADALEGNYVFEYCRRVTREPLLLGIWLAALAMGPIQMQPRASRTLPDR